MARASGVNIKITTESKSELGFANGHKILSLPQNPATVRGFSGHLFLDEFGHHSQDSDIYTAAVPVTTRGFRLAVLSTPMGQSGEYYKCWTERPDFSKHDTNIHDAVRLGLAVDVESIKRNMDDESFRQEYLCEFVDESTAYFPYGLIRDAIGERPQEYGECYIGVDIGRHRDLTAIYVLGKLGEMHTTVHLEILDGQPFEVQRVAIESLASRYNAQGLMIDATGMGAQLAEQLQEKMQTATAVTFTNDVKRDLAVGVKMALEGKRLQIPDDPKLISDIHAVRRTVTAANNVRFEAERTAEGHADRFWALALALRAATNTSGFQVLFEC